MSYVNGSTLFLTATFTDTAGVATQMTTVTLDILTDDGLIEAVESGDIDFNATTKEYSYSYTTTQAGIHDYRWTGVDAGGSVAIIEKQFFVVDVFA